MSSPGSDWWALATHEGSTSSISQSCLSSLSLWPCSHTALVEWSKPILNFLLTIQTEPSSSHASCYGSSPRSWVTFALPFRTAFSFSPDIWSTDSGTPACGANAAQKHPFCTEILCICTLFQCSFYSHWLAEHNSHLASRLCVVTSAMPDFWFGSSKGALLKRELYRKVETHSLLLFLTTPLFGCSRCLVQFHVSSRSALGTGNTCQQTCMGSSLTN